MTYKETKSGLLVPATLRAPKVRSESGGYEGAARGPRFGGWLPSSGGPSSIVAYSLGEMRRRQRQQTRDNPVAQAARDQYVTQVIGRGIRPKLGLDDAGLAAEIHALWNISVNEMDIEERNDFYGLQELLLHAMFDGGEVLARRSFADMDEGLAVPLQVQLLEPDHLDDGKQSTADAGRRVRFGIELGRNGKRVGYWLFPFHPGEVDFFSGPGLSERHDAADVLHCFRARRPGQLRGVPHLHATLLKLYNLDQYQDAELERKKQAAMHVGSIYTNSGDLDPEVVFPSGEDWAADRNAYYAKLGGRRPGEWPVLAPGDRIDYNNPPDVGAGYIDFSHEQKREIAAATGVTFEQLTGYMKDVNYSSARARLIDIRRALSMDQRRVVFQFCRGVWRWWMEAAVASGALKIRDFEDNRAKYLNPEWVPDAFASVDPLKDHLADLGDVRAGFDSKRQKQIERGRDPDQLNREIAADNATADQMEFVFDSDPRRQTKSGAAQKAADRIIDAQLEEA